MKWLELPGPRPPECWRPEQYMALGISEFSASAAYHTMTAMIVPRPVALVSTLDAEGLVNVAPFSFFNGVCSSPPILSIAIIRKPGRDGLSPSELLKDTARNIRAQREFVVNICRPNMAATVQEAGVDHPAEISEAELTGMSLIPSHKIAAPRVANAPIQLECVLEQILEVGDGSTDLVLGRIVEVHVLQELLDKKGRIQVDKLDPLSRLAAGSFAGLKESFRYRKP